MIVYGQPGPEGRWGGAQAATFEGEKEREMTRSIASPLTSLFVAASLALFLSVAAPARAQMSRNRVNRVQRQQQAQIRMGVRNGALSKHQAARLERHAKDIKATERNDNMKGAPTPQERQQLKGDLKRQQQAIQGAESHNAPKPVTGTPPTAAVPPSAPEPAPGTPPLG